MKIIKNIIVIVVLGLLLFMLSSCDTMAVYERPGYGPPPHAKAHGLRAKQPDTVVIFNVD